MRGSVLFCTSHPVDKCLIGWSLAAQRALSTGSTARVGFHGTLHLAKVCLSKVLANRIPAMSPSNQGSQHKARMISASKELLHLQNEHQTFVCTPHLHKRSAREIAERCGKTAAAPKECKQKSQRLGNSFSSRINKQSASEHQAIA